MRFSMKVCALLVVAALGAAACDENERTPSGPSTTAPTVTESFTGSITRNGAMTFSFSVSTTGQVTATLATLEAAEGTVLGLSLGNWNGTTCQIVLANDSAKQGTFITGTMSAAGNLCLRVYDSTGNLESTANFKVDVVHP